jgi:hypothetical protein
MRLGFRYDDKLPGGAIIPHHPYTPDQNGCQFSLSVLSCQLKIHLIFSLITLYVKFHPIPPPPPLLGVKLYLGSTTYSTVQHISYISLCAALGNPHVKYIQRLKSF